jgi:hypothetical protein
MWRGAGQHPQMSMPSFFEPSRPIQEYSEMIYFFGEEYVKKMVGCQGRIETL